MPWTEPAYTEEQVVEAGEVLAAAFASREGEPHPVKALSEFHHVTISAASRWVKEARRRGYIE